MPHAPTAPVLIDFCDPHGAGAALRCAFAAPVQTLVAHTPDQVKPVLDAVQAAAQQGHWCVGYVRYEAAPAFDAALAVHAGDGPLAWFAVYKQALPWPEAEPEPDTTAPAATQASWHSSLSRTDFEAGMARIHHGIASGAFYQVNYTAPLVGTWSGSAVALFQRLHRAQPRGYAAFIDTGSERLLSVSPELFFDWQPGSDGHGGQLLTRPMKGTAPRGATPAEDAARVQAMLASPKERAENVMIVDLLRNDVSRIAQPFSVQVPELFKVQSLPTVHQMVSDVTAQTRPGTTLADVFGALFPCGSVTGAPKVRAMQEICALEPRPRGVYCGAVGVVRPGGHATFNVAIRTVTLHGDQARCGIGSGITADARADAEWQEWQHKRVFLDRASEPFELLETLRLEHGVYINLRAHLARLARAAAHFGYPFDETRIRAALQTLTESRLCQGSAAIQTPAYSRVADLHCDDTSTWRVRLLLNAEGQPQVEKFILNQPLAHVYIALAATYFEASQSEFTRFKTTRRSHYDAFAPTDPAVFDTLLYNAAGELTECTRGNIALLLDGHWVTPPLHCGLLDGVGRELCLQDGRLREAVVRLQDLPRVQAFAFVNSLRGWVDARLVAGVTIVSPFGEHDV